MDYITSEGDMDTVDFGFVWANGGDHAGIGELAVGGDARLGHVLESVGAVRHASDDALGEAAKNVGQAVAPD